MIRIPMSYVEQRMYRLGLAGAGQAGLIEHELWARRGKVLNIGCGPLGEQIHNLSPMATFVAAADHCTGTVIEAKADFPESKALFLGSEAEQLPFADFSFDYILALGLLRYFQNFEGLFAEFGRVLSSSGKLFATNSVSSPASPILRAAEQNGFKTLLEDRAACPAASGDLKERYLWIFGRPEARRAPNSPQRSIVDLRKNKFARE